MIRRILQIPPFKWSLLLEYYVMTSSDSCCNNLIKKCIARKIFFNNYITAKTMRLDDFYV